MKTHKLKLNIEFCDDVMNGIKTFEIRKNDRGFQTGDRIVFVPVEGGLKTKTYHPIETKEYVITYVLNEWGLERGYVALAIKEVKHDM